MPIELDHEDHSVRGRIPGHTDDRAQPRRCRHGLFPVAGTRRKHRRNSCSSRAEEAVRLLGSARITN
jgi:hypothetical protein